MKKIFNLSLIALLTLCFSCDKDDDGIDETSGAEMEFTVAEFSAVNVDGEVQVDFKRQAAQKSSGTAGFTIKINATPEQREGLHITTENGVLLITAEEGIQLSDGVVIEVESADLEEIRLESDQVAEFYGLIDEELEVVTEANSLLYLYDTQVDHLISRTEGESKLIVTTFHEDLETETAFEEERGVLLHDHLLLVDGRYLVVGESIVLEEGIWIVSGDDVYSDFQIQTMDFITEGNTLIDASLAFTRTVNINLEGESEASVWAWERITGKGEGNSVLYFQPVEGVDISGFTTEGNAQIIPLN